MRKKTFSYQINFKLFLRNFIETKLIGDKTNQNSNHKPS